ncbi:MAG TPA: TonB-dependent receptor [Vicinamibacterales bacterium]|nr:TonB-dependent receptor [Vicinamibacterales bacterium]
MPTLSCRIFQVRYGLRALAAATTIAAAVPAFAQTTGASSPPPATPRVSQSVVVTASLAPESLDALTRSVTVLTREDLDLMGLTSVIDALRFVPGTDARARGPMDVQTDFSLRGATFGQNLMLADGLRLNDSQTGHHNGEIPLPSVAVDRIEVVTGAASATYGSDALGGTINVISRRDDYQAASVSYGQHGDVDAQGAIGGGVLPDGWTLAGWASRSDGFTFDREFAQGGGAARGPLAHGFTIDVRHQRRAFGANGFYGPSPSKEWTDQTIAALRWQHAGAAWTTVIDGSAKNHGDHFRWDIARPGFAENHHRTNAGDVRVTLARRVRRATFTVGGSGGGDRVHSNNLGDHDYARGSVFAEWQSPIRDRTTLVAGLRVDTYSTFGTSTSPSVSFVTRVAPNVRLRASAAHAFRVPTFTELYYSDPSNIGNPDLHAERGWSVDGGLDWTHRSWTGSVSVFGRWDRDVIDYLRATIADRWQAMNVRDVTTRGVEVSATRLARGALIRASYTALDVSAPSVDLLSKYVLEYVRHQAGLSLSVPFAGGMRAAVNVDVRNRIVAQTWASYALVGARVSRTFGRADLFVDASNLFDQDYVEIAGVDMPGRWVSVGVTLR